MLSKCYPKLSQYEQLEELHKCKYCGKAYKYSSGLSKHISNLLYRIDKTV